MKQPTLKWSNIINSVGIILTTVMAMIYFGRQASVVGKAFLYLLGALAILMAVSLLVPWHHLPQVRHHTSARIAEWYTVVETWQTQPVDQRVKDELQRAAA